MDKDGTILVVDDSRDALEVLSRNLEARGFRVFCAQSVGEALEILGFEKVAVVVTDLKMPGSSGLDLVRHVRENIRDTEVLMITGYPSVEGAVEAMKIGAADYLPKPFTADELDAAVRRSLDRLKARRSVATRAAESAGIPGMIGASSVMQGVFRSIKEHAGGSQPVLIRGEAGTGRRSVARALHLMGGHAKEPFRIVDCRAMQGSFGEALSGTLYVEEVASCLPEEQAAILRHIESGASGRVVCSASVDLAAMAGRGRFNNQLHARLAKCQITLPPLRERGDDLPMLIHALAERAALEQDLPAPGFSDSAIEALRRHSWPGNVAELWWTLRRLTAGSSGGVIEVLDLPDLMRFSAQSASHERSLDEVEAEHIRRVLAGVDGNRTRAAEILGIDRKTLREKLRRSPPGQ